MASFFNWLYSFVRWLRGKATDERPRYVRRYSSKDGKTTLLLLSQSSSEFPGVVSIWWVENADAENDYPFVLCNLAQIREELGQKGAGDRMASTTDTPGISEFQRLFEVKAKQEIHAQRHILGSHLLIIGAISKAPTRTRFVNNQVRHYRYLDFVHCVVANLQRDSWQVRNLGANDDAEKIIARLMMRVLVLEGGPLNSWEELLWGVDWVVWLDHFAVERLGPTHVTRPPKSAGRGKK